MSSSLDVLVDSHVLLWLADQPARLGEVARQRLASARAHVSAITYVEFAMKEMVGKLSTALDLSEAAHRAGLVSLPFTERHAPAMTRFPELVGHDPFDRMLLAQAHAERMDFLTADRRLLALGRDWIVDARE